jgi:hypothetical protein
MIEHRIRRLSEECEWLNRFKLKQHAIEVIGRWIDRQHKERSHLALECLTPAQFGMKLAA